MVTSPSARNTIQVNEESKCATRDATQLTYVKNVTIDSDGTVPYKHDSKH